MRSRNVQHSLILLDNEDAQSPVYGKLLHTPFQNEDELDFEFDIYAVVSVYIQPEILRLVYIRMNKKKIIITRDKPVEQSGIF